MIVWWEGRTDFQNLRHVALKLFSLVPANSACERNFSNYSFIHSKLRNRLDNDTARKGVYVFANSKEETERRDNPANDELKAANSAVDMSDDEQEENFSDFK